MRIEESTAFHIGGFIHQRLLASPGAPAPGTASTLSGWEPRTISSSSVTMFGKGSSAEAQGGATPSPGSCWPVPQEGRSAGVLLCAGGCVAGTGEESWAPRCRTPVEKTKKAQNAERAPPRKNRMQLEAGITGQESPISRAQQFGKAFCWHPLLPFLRFGAW